MVAPARHKEFNPSLFKSKYLFLLFSWFTLLIFPVTSFQPQKDDSAHRHLIDRITSEQQRQAGSTTDTIGPGLTSKKIYITFDDGPNNGTRNVWKAVREDSIPVSFFIVGRHVFDSPKQTATWHLLKADSMIQLCNHGYSHAQNRYTRYYRNPDAVRKDFERNKEKLGFGNTVARMPGRNAWRIDSVSLTDLKGSIAAIDAVYEAGFSVIGWDLEWMVDHKTLSLTTNAGQLFRQVAYLLAADKTTTPGHLVLLLHDQAFQTRASIEKLHTFFRLLKNDPGYELALAADYPGVKK